MLGSRVPILLCATDAIAVKLTNVQKHPQNRVWHVLIPFLIAAGVLYGFWLWSIRHPRIVASAVAPDGTELRVVQTCNWSAEPFTTEVFYRKPGGPWGWFDYDHEDGYWLGGEAEVDAGAKRINIKRGQEITATFEWETEAFELRRRDMPHRRIVGAQEWRDPPPASR